MYVQYYLYVKYAIFLHYSDLARILVRHSDFDNMKEVVNEVIKSLVPSHDRSQHYHFKYGATGFNTIDTSSDFSDYSRTTLFREFISQMPGDCMIVKYTYVHVRTYVCIY